MGEEWWTQTSDMRVNEQNNKTQMESTHQLLKEPVKMRLTTLLCLCFLKKCPSLPAAPREVPRGQWPIDFQLSELSKLTEWQSLCGWCWCGGAKLGLLGEGGSHLPGADSLICPLCQANELRLCIYLWLHSLHPNDIWFFVSQIVWSFCILMNFKSQNLWLD